MLRIILLFTYSLGFTILFQGFLTFYSNYQKILFSGFILIPLLLFGIFKIYEKSKNENPLNFSKFITYRIAFCIVITLASDYIYPICSKIDLTNIYNNFTLLDDEYYYDDPYAEYDPGPYGGGGHDDSGYFSNVKVFFSNNDKIDGALIGDERIRKNQFEEYTLVIDDEPVTLNMTKSYTAEYAYLNGYRYYDNNKFEVSHLKLPFNYLLEILLKEGIYTLLSFFILLIMYLKDENNLFEESKADNT